ncbi:MAG: hypothetical protein DI569_04330 [Sphingopyxis macrogoltabida]|uniref:Uncharacterized protein n=1 Tax=Sphingopyxis macrogoltabida TaxID=33050 RepID=A0A2W5L3A1_SPHMC|nr:MAG: hypothetical protein DI569_04330 [Sphingopyxis macrogoltabida]
MSLHRPADYRRVETPAPIDAILPDRGVRVVRSFDLPTRLYAATVGLYFAYLGVMAAAFSDRGLIVPMAIFVITIAMAFAVPAMWVRMQPGHAARPLPWHRFMQDGIDTHTGRLGGAGAAAQVLILPVLIFGWGLIVAAIVATL